MSARTGSGRRERDAVATARDAVRTMILTGQISPGQELSQLGLAAQLGISTTPLREALRHLEAEGFVESRRNRRHRVPPFDPADLEAIYSGRVLLESLGVSLSVPQLGESDVAALREHLRAMRTAADDAAWDGAHAEFHLGLVAFTGPPLRRELARLMALSDRYRRMSVHGDDVQGRQLGEQEHEAILEASAAGDGRAAGLLLARHLTRSALTVLAHLAPDYDPAAVRGALQMVISWAA